MADHLHLLLLLMVIHPQVLLLRLQMPLLTWVILK
jgi:hypothetical protein